MPKSKEKSNQLLDNETKDIIAAMHAAMAHGIPDPKENDQVNE